MQDGGNYKVLRIYEAYFPSYALKYKYSEGSRNYKLITIKISEPFLCAVSTSTHSYYIKFAIYNPLYFFL
jgi:hypothetical protein